MDTFNRLLDDIIPHSFVIPAIYNEFIILSLFRYKFIIINEITANQSLSKTEQKRQVLEINRKITSCCLDASKLDYTKIDMLDKINKDHIIIAIINYLNEAIPNSSFFIEDYVNDNDTSYGGRENEYMVFSYSKFPSLFLNFNTISFITGYNNLDTVFNSYIDNYELLYENISKRNTFQNKTKNEIKDIFKNKNLSLDSIKLIIEEIIQYTNMNIVVLLNNGTFLLNKSILKEKITIFVYLIINEGIPNYWSIIKSYNLNDQSINDYNVSELKSLIINKMIEESFNKESAPLIPDQQDFTEPLKKIQLDFNGKNIILLVGKSGILYKTVTNEIVGVIELIHGDYIPETNGLCNIQWIKGYADLL